MGHVTSWGEVLRLLGLEGRYAVREGRGFTWVAIPAGALMSAIADLVPLPGPEFAALQLLAGAAFFIPIAAWLGPPAASRRGAALPYPRPGRARVRPGDLRSPIPTDDEGATGSEKAPDELDVDGLVLFYVAPKDARVYSRPACGPPGSLMDSIVLSLLSLRPRLAWLQVAWGRADFARELRWMKVEMDSELRTRTGRGLAAPVAGAIEAAASGGAVAVSIRGAIVGSREEDAFSLPLSRCSDDFDHLAAFPTRDPGLLAAMAARDPLSSYLVRAMRHRHVPVEPPAFLETPDLLPHYTTIPSVGPFEWSPGLGIPAIAAWDVGDVDAAPPGGALRMRGIPRVEGGLRGEEAARLSALAASSGSIEVILRLEGKGDVIVTGGLRVMWVLESVYGGLDAEPVDPRAPVIELLDMLRRASPDA